MAKTNIGIIGLGTVGTGVVKLLSDDKRFKLKLAAVRETDKPRDVDTTKIRVSSDPFEMGSDPEVEMVVEVAGGTDPFYELTKRAITQGKHIVTANKELVAKHGAELFNLAKQNNVTIMFEAAVGGGIPLISTLQRGLQANEIQSVAGILNGTTNFILTQMEMKGQSFHDALVDAQSLGFAEADPTNDVKGFDVAYKISILASLAFGRFVEPNAVFRQGITRIIELDIKTPLEFGYRIKMIGLAQRNGDKLDMRAHPILVPLHHLLASVEGANNAIYIKRTA